MLMLVRLRTQCAFYTVFFYSKSKYILSHVVTSNCYTILIHMSKRFQKTRVQFSTKHFWKKEFLFVVMMMIIIATVMLKACVQKEFLFAFILCMYIHFLTVRLILVSRMKKASAQHADLCIWAPPFRLNVLQKNRWWNISLCTHVQHVLELKVVKTR